MPATISVTEDGLFAALRLWLIDILDADPLKVLQTQQNRASMPDGDFIYITPLWLKGLSYPRVVYDPANDQRIDSRTNEWAVQVDFYGESAYEQAVILSTIMKTDVATQDLQDTPITPLHADDAKQMAIINSEQQWEQRWMVEMRFQAEMAVTTEQLFADTLTINVVEIETEFPPGE